MLFILSQYDGVTFSYTPLINVNADYDSKIKGYYKKILKAKKFDFPRNHFYFNHDYIANDMLLFDGKAVKKIQKFLKSGRYQVIIRYKIIAFHK